MCFFSYVYNKKKMWYTSAPTTVMRAKFSIIRQKRGRERGREENRRKGRSVGSACLLSNCATDERIERCCVHSHSLPLVSSSFYIERCECFLLFFFFVFYYTLSSTLIYLFFYLFFSFFFCVYFFVLSMLRVTYRYNIYHYVSNRKKMCA